MKKSNLFLFAILVVACVLASCNSNNKNESKNEIKSDGIVGQWEFRGVIPEIESSDQAATDVIKSFILMESSSVDSETVVEFTEDGKMYNGIGTGGIYSVSGDKVTVSGDGLSGTTDFELKGDSLFVTEDITEMCNGESMRDQMGIANEVKVTKATMKGIFVKRK